MKIPELYQLYKQQPIISTDTRHLPDGCLYFSLKGKNFNGNHFAADALNRGAAWAVVDEAEFVTSDRCILVTDVLKTLQQLARYHRDQFKIPVLGITGSNGKTTTKELLAAVLSQKLKAHVTKGNLNNHIGVPLTILSMPADTDIAVIEMGANKVGDNAELCEIFNPNFGIITNIGKEHLEGFGDLEGVARGNSELYVYLLKHHGTAFVNNGAEHLVRMAARISRQVTYALDVQADYSGKPLQLNPGIHLQIMPEGEEYKSALFGRYNAENVMAAIAIGSYFGLSPHEIREGITAYIPSNNRSQIIEKGDNILYVDCYNANPTSMEVAINNFMETPVASRTKVLMLGDMFEMGEHEFEEHKNLAGKLQQLKNVQIFLCGKAFGLHKNDLKCTWFETSSELSEYLKKHAVHQAEVLIKGSRGMKMEKVLEAF